MRYQFFLDTHSKPLEQRETFKELASIVKEHFHRDWYIMDTLKGRRYGKQETVNILRKNGIIIKEE